MALNIKVIVHGVPRGQKSWNCDDTDSNYISNFYNDSFCGFDEQLFVEVKSAGNNLFAYYTFVKGKNVCAFDGRSGSYFALTVRVNELYIDAQNMHNVLRSAYEKLYMDCCIVANGSSIKYSIDDFNSVKDKLAEFEKSIINYIGTFSVSNDIVSISGLAPTTGTVASINYLECNKQVFISYLKAGNKTSISLLHPTKREAQIIAAKNNELSNVQNQCQKNIEECRSKFTEENQKLNMLLQESNANKQKEVADVKRQYEQRINNLTDENKNLKRQVTSLQKQVTSSGNTSCVVEKPGILQLVRRILPFVNTILLVLILGVTVLYRNNDTKAEATFEQTSVEEQKNTNEGDISTDETTLIDAHETNANATVRTNDSEESKTDKAKKDATPGTEAKQNNANNATGNTVNASGSSTNKKQ